MPEPLACTPNLEAREGNGSRYGSGLGNPACAGSWTYLLSGEGVSCGLRLAPEKSAE